MNDCRLKEHALVTLFPNAGSLSPLGGTNPPLQAQISPWGARRKGGAVKRQDLSATELTLKGQDWAPLGKSCPRRGPQPPCACPHPDSQSGAPGSCAGRTEGACGNSAIQSPAPPHHQVTQNTCPQAL